jgi:hypothetical protein
MRFLATYPDLVATVDPAGLAIHQFVGGTIEVDAAFGHVRLDMRTEYPWDGTLGVTVVDAPGGEWTLSTRAPAWCRAGSVSVGGDVTPIEPGTGEVSLTRPWRNGDEMRIALEMPVRLTMPDRRIDAIRGTVAVERGPLVYAVEEADLPVGATLETIEADPATPPGIAAPDPALPGMTVVDVAVRVRDSDAPDGWPYRPASAPAVVPRSATVRAVPYFAWGNRGPGGMRVWIPRPD